MIMLGTVHIIVQILQVVQAIITILEGVSGLLLMILLRSLGEGESRKNIQKII